MIGNRFASIKGVSDILKIAICVFSVVCFLVLYYKAELAFLPKPISHQTDILTGEYEVTIGKIREINIRCQKKYENVDLTVSVVNENGDIAFQKEYKGIDIFGEFTLIDYYTRENPLVVEPGKYVAKFFVNGIENKDIVGRFVEYSGDYKKIFFAFGAIISLIMILLIWVIKFLKLQIEYLYLVCAIVMGIFWNFVAPPLAMPDEYSHFLEAYQLTNYIYGTSEKDENGHIMVRADDYNNIVYLHNIATASEWYSEKKTANLDEMVSADIVSTVSIRAKYAYGIPAIGISIARLLHLNGKMLLLLGRMFNLIILSYLMFMAIKIAPYGKIFFASIGLIPEIVLLLSSYSYDGLNFAMCVLIVSYYMHLSEQKNIEVKEIFTFIALILLMIPIKNVYCFFAFLLFLLPREKINISAKASSIAFIISVVGISIFLILGVRVVALVAGVNAVTEASENMDNNMLINIRYVLENPKQILYIFFRTLYEDTNRYICRAFGQLFGRAKDGGLIDYNMPAWMCDVVIITLFIGVNDVRKNLLSRRKKVFVLGIACMSSLAVLASMLFACTTVSSEKILGLQGRYFLPILTLIPLVFSSNKLEFHLDRKKICIGNMVFVNMFYAFLAVDHYIHNFF